MPQVNRQIVLVWALASLIGLGLVSAHRHGAFAAGEGQRMAQAAGSPSDPTRRRAEELSRDAGNAADTFFRDGRVLSGERTASWTLKTGTALDDVIAWVVQSTAAYRTHVAPRLATGGGFARPSRRDTATVANTERGLAGSERRSDPSRFDTIVTRVSRWVVRAVDAYDGDIVPRLSGGLSETATANDKTPEAKTAASDTPPVPSRWQTSQSETPRTTPPEARQAPPSVEPDRGATPSPRPAVRAPAASPFERDGDVAASSSEPTSRSAATDPPATPRLERPAVVATPADPTNADRLRDELHRAADAKRREEDARRVEAERKAELARLAALERQRKAALEEAERRKLLAALPSADERRRWAELLARAQTAAEAVARTRTRVVPRVSVAERRATVIARVENDQQAELVTLRRAREEIESARGRAFIGEAIVRFTRHYGDLRRSAARARSVASDWRGIRDRISVDLGMARTGVTSAETVLRRLETTPGRQSRRALELRLVRAVMRVERLRSRASSRLTSAPQPVAIPEVRRVAGVIARARTLVDPEPPRLAGVPLPQRKPLSSRGARVASVRATTDAVRSYTLPERNPAAQRREDRRRFRPAARVPDRRSVVAIPDPPTRNARRSLRVARVERRVTRRDVNRRRATKRRVHKARARSRTGARAYRRRRWRGRYRSRRYVVRRGDSLWAISRRFYGRGRRYRRIYVANRAILRRPSRIYPGQRLIIPAVRQR